MKLSQKLTRIAAIYIAVVGGIAIAHHLSKEAKDDDLDTVETRELNEAPDLSSAIQV